MNRKFLLLLSLPLLLLLLPSAVSDLAGDRAALLALRAAVGGRSLLWNTTASTTPCSFPGVVCANFRVTELHFPANSLSGELPENTLGNLTGLTTLSLRFNSLSGSLPVDLSALVNLRNLYLQSNRFSGPIPESIFSLPNLVRVNLASNQFSGPILPKFNSLTRLGTLYLENNNLTGSIPILDQPGLVQFNVSNNRLSGAIPVQLENKPAGSFAGNLGLCGKPLAPCNETTPYHKKKLSGGAIAGIIVGSVLGFLLILGLILCCIVKQGSKKSSSKEVSAVSQTEIEIPAEKAAPSVAAAAAVTPAPPTQSPKVGLGGDKSLVFFGKKAEMGYDLEDLLKASAEVLGKGTFGTAYKAGLEGGAVVAVKRLKEVTVAETEFREKIEVVGRMEHENLVGLRAYYFSRDEKLLVYDYMPMGSLSALLHGNKGATRTPLNWETRSSITLGAARGIAYLHSQGLSHGNIKSSNILLTKSYEARVSDFGLSQLAGPTPTPNRVEGYRAPEVTDPRKVSLKADVYSFGVLVLELLTGKAPTHASSNEEGVDLPRWVQSVVREEWNNAVFDPELLRYQSVTEEMVQLLQLAIDCVTQYPDNRPSMSDISRRIEDLCRSQDSIQDAD